MTQAAFCSPSIPTPAWLRRAPYSGSFFAPLSPALKTTHGCTARLRSALALGSRQEVAVARVRMIKPEEADADTRKVYDGVR